MIWAMCLFATVGENCAYNIRLFHNICIHTYFILILLTKKMYLSIHASRATIQIRSTWLYYLAFKCVHTPSSKVLKYVFGRLYPTELCLWLLYFLKKKKKYWGIWSDRVKILWKFLHIFILYNYIVFLYFHRDKYHSSLSTRICFYLSSNPISFIYNRTCSIG